MSIWDKFKKGFTSGEKREPKRPPLTDAEKQTAVWKVGQDPIDPTVTPIDNPMDVREDGSIRPGDPMWDMMQRVMETGETAMGNQRDDGTWDIEYRKD